MDLFNNKKGRDCSNIWLDCIYWTSDDILKTRVETKLNNGELQMK